MATFLELCQDVASDSGTIADGQLQSVVNQRGRLGKVVRYTSRAWRLIQLSDKNWNWMKRDFISHTIPNTQAYTSAALGINNLANFNVNEPLFISNVQYPQRPRELKFCPYDTFRENFLRIPTKANTPIYWTVRPEDEAIILSPTPDDTYEIKGRYRKSAQVLSENDDTPEFPEDHHDIIIYRALMLLEEHDESAFKASTARRDFSESLTYLTSRQLPQIQLPGALA